MAFFLDICDAPITCHAWNADGSLVALCPNTSDILIYSVKGKESTLLHTLSEHTQVVSSIDWHPKTNRIISCSHDRNAYVWTPEGAKPEAWKWKKNLVLLRLSRAATFCRWSPDGTTFIVATGTNKVRYCQYQESHKWWTSTNLGHKKPTAVTVDYTPDGKHIFLACTDRHAYYLTADVAEAKELSRKAKKANNIVSSYAAQGWVNAAAVSPDGSWVAYTSQDSYIRFLKAEELNGKEDEKRELNISGLPLLSLSFINDHFLIGAGFDCAPRAFFRNGDTWEDLGIVDRPEIRDSGAAKAGGMANRMAAYGQPVKTQAAQDNLHYNIIVGIRVTKDAFSTCGNDGRIVVWPFAAVKKVFPNKGIL